MTEIFAALRSDHSTQRRLLDLVSRTHGDSSGRRELFLRLVRELRSHADAEERSLYARMLADETSQPKGGHSVKEHKEIDELIETLEKMDFSNPNWIRKFEDLKEMVEHHLDEEEHEVFQIAGKVLSASEKEELGKRYAEEKNKESAAYPASI